MTRRDALAILPAALLTSACEHNDENPKYSKVRWMGHPWTIEWSKTAETAEVIGIWGPDWQFFKPDDPNLPFKIVEPKDGEGDYQLAPLADSAPRRAAAKHYVYVLDIYSQDQIIVFEQETGRYRSHFDVDRDPQGIALSRDGTRLYVTHLEIKPDNGFFPPAPPRISVFNTATGTLLQTINLPLGKVPRKPVFSPDGAKLYIPNDGTTAGTTSVLIVDVPSNTYTGEILTGSNLALVNRLVITPDGAMIYAGGMKSFGPPLLAIDVASATVTVKTLNLAPRDMLLNPTGSRLYLATDNLVVVYDTATLTEIARIDFSSGPNPRFNNLAISFDGGTLFVNHQFSQAVSMIDTATNTLLGQLGDTAKLLDGSFTLVVPLGPSLG